MDRLVGERIMGWKPIKFEPMKDGAISLAPGSVNFIGEPYESLPPEYSTDMALAWEIVDMKKALEPSLTWNDENHLWRFGFDKRPSDEAQYDESPMLAICRAVLSINKV